VKLTVITDSNGKVIGTAPQDTAQDQPVVRLVAGAGQKAHEIELPADLTEMESAEDLHAALERHLSE